MLEQCHVHILSEWVHMRMPGWLYWYTLRKLTERLLSKQLLKWWRVHSNSQPVCIHVSISKTKKKSLKYLIETCMFKMCVSTRLHWTKLSNSYKSVCVNAMQKRWRMHSKYKLLQLWLFDRLHRFRVSLIPYYVTKARVRIHMYRKSSLITPWWASFFWIHKVMKFKAVQFPDQTRKNPPIAVFIKYRKNCSLFWYYVCMLIDIPWRFSGCISAMHL